MEARNTPTYTPAQIEIWREYMRAALGNAASAAVITSGEWDAATVAQHAGQLADAALQEEWKRSRLSPTPPRPLREEGGRER
jgi:hypothetical protein